MVDSRSLVAMLPRPVRTLPADLAAVLVVLILTNVAVLAPVIRETPLRVPLGLAFVLFVPGYAFIAALFPEAGVSPTAEEDLESSGDDDSGGLIQSRVLDRDRSGIDGIERVALSFGLSIAITPLLGLVLNFTPWGIRLVPIMVTVSAFTAVATAVAAVRRWELPEDERFHVPYREWYAAGRSELLEPDTRGDAVLNVILVLSVMLAIGTVSYAVVVPPEGEQFSAVYVLGEDDDGELVADNYPTNFTQGESQEIVLGVDNHEHRTVDYTVVLVEQRVSTETNETVNDDGETVVENETVVEEQRELDRFETQLAHNESWHHPHDIEPTMTGEDIRLVWLLYPDGEVPEEPSMESTEYSVHLWVDVSAE
ncbi:DUF1616 domain-containing protein [Natronorubrum aibiense]|uniref:DUF1616 domain-containing protein n=1 Tax=Natronorubrum aibiense TaxID=348826 RepID=A0A5P9P2C0_9EURY|nr:DUF1616 domain-containing protein [Natronorubrum aibiense]QFU82268.1 DUF1616 domain-containing protein [Natronorubrum aibiense]